jgi:hypothetical protein
LIGGLLVLSACRHQQSPSWAKEHSEAGGESGQKKKHQPQCEGTGACSAASHERRVRRKRVAVKRPAPGAQSEAAQASVRKRAAHASATAMLRCGRSICAARPSARSIAVSLSFSTRASSSLNVSSCACRTQPPTAASTANRHCVGMLPHCKLQTEHTSTVHQKPAKPTLDASTALSPLG